MPDISPQTKSFIILSALAVFCVCLSLVLWFNLSTPPHDSYDSLSFNYAHYRISPARQFPNSSLKAQIARPQKVDTANWKTYVNTEYGFSFQYRPDWKILKPIKKHGYTVFRVDPGKKYYNIKIFANPEEFYIMGGLPAKSEIIAGVPALNVNNALYGIVANNLHYTFDVGLSMRLLPDFNALVHSVKFGG